MPRRPRDEAPGAFHHVVPQGNNRSCIVHDDHDRSELLRHVAAATARHGGRCHAYCLLDTHLHLVVETPSPDLGLGMGRLLGRYARAFNHRHSREGHLFASPFFSRRIRADEHLVPAVLYVMLNPVRAGLCVHPREWPWCSYAATARGAEGFVATDLVLGMLATGGSDGRERFRQLVDEQVAVVAAERSRERGRPVRR